MKLNIQLFAHTNATTNYELPQFVGTDKPTWLGDFNEAMADIDAGMHENASDIASMESDVASATAAASQASQDVTTLTGTVNSLSSTVSSVQTTANNASQTASSALNTANTANGKADANSAIIATNTSDISDLQDDVNLMKPVVLYENASGSNGTITLSQSASNFKYLEVYFRTNDGAAYRGCQKCVVDTTATNHTLLFMQITTIGIYAIKGKEITISGTTISSDKYTEIQPNGYNNSNHIYITNVLGYK